MINNTIRIIITFLTVNLNDAEIPSIDEFISDYQQIKPIEDPVFWLSCGAFICLMSGLIFADIMKSKLNYWSTILFGTSMWKAIKDLLFQVEAGTVKEIDDFF